MTAETMTLYRCVDTHELGLILTTAWARFPARSPGKSVLHCVTSEDHARRRARDRTGYVVRFVVSADAADRFGRGNAASADEIEFGIPAEALDAFNAAIVGGIDLIAEYAE